MSETGMEAQALGLRDGQWITHRPTRTPAYDVLAAAFNALIADYCRASFPMVQPPRCSFDLRESPDAKRRAVQLVAAGVELDGVSDLTWDAAPRRLTSRKPLGPTAGSMAPIGLVSFLPDDSEDEQKLRGER